MEKENLKILKKCLIVVDMVNGFINEGTMSDQNIRHIIEENECLINNFIYNKYPIIAFKDCHLDDAIEFKTFPKHCIKGTSESELIDELKKYEENMKIFEKNSTNGMYADGFINYINNLKDVEEFVITGCCTDICVMQLALGLKTYFNAINRRVNVVVPMNAVETYNSIKHNNDEYNLKSFDFMNNAGIQVVSEYKKLEKKY